MLSKLLVLTPDDSSSVLAIRKGNCPQNIPNQIDSKAFRWLYKAFWSTLEVPDRKLVALAFCSYPIRSCAVFDVFTYAHVRKPFGIC